MGKILGIDLGTTNCCVAVVEGVSPQVLANREGSRTTPSIVAFTEDGDRLVGPDRQAPGDHQPAEHGLRGQAPDRPEVRATRDVAARPRGAALRARRGGQRRRQDPDPRPRSTARRRSPPSSCARSRSSPRRPWASRSREAIITVPAYFDDAQRQATHDAGRIAGPRGAAHHQRAHRGGARLRPRPRTGSADDRGLRPRRRHLRHLDPRARRRHLRGQGDRRRHVPRRRGLRPADHGLAARRLPQARPASTCARTAWRCSG